jgi:hypothetical protein
MNHINQSIELCRSCAMDVATLANMRSCIIPSLERELEELRNASNSLTTDEQRAHWDESGMNDGIEKIEAAIAHFEWRIAQVAA